MDAKELALFNSFKPPGPVGDKPVHVNLLIYGSHKVGKTVLGCSIVKPGGKVLLYDMDGDWKSLLNHPEIMEYVDETPYELPVKLKVLAKAFEEQIPPYDQYDTFVIDPLSTWVDNFLRAFTKGVSFNAKNPRGVPMRENAEGWDMIKSFDIKLRDLRDYGVVRDELQPIIQSLIEAPVNVIFLAHERDPSQEDEGAFKGKIRADFPGKTLTLVARKCDAIGRMTRDGNKRTITFETNKQTEAGSRIKELDNKNLNADDIPNLINQYRFNGEK